MSKGIYEITDEFEQALCDYTGAPYAVALDNCSNAIFLALLWWKKNNIHPDRITIPKHTYMSVPCEIIHAGFKVVFEANKFFVKEHENGDKEHVHNILHGDYRLKPSPVVDSALRFTADMYNIEEDEGLFYCLSFTGPYKHLKLGKGGAILTDNKEAYEWFRRMRYSGRREISYHEDSFDMIGYNFYMMPEIAARGLMLMKQFYNPDGTKKHNEDLCLPYPDLSQFKVYQQ